MPTRSVEALAKILELEQANGYGDVVVIGGLDAYLRRHFRTAEDKEPSTLISRICPPDFRYTDLTRNERRQWAEKVRQYIGEVSIGKQPGGEVLGGGRVEATGKRLGAEGTSGVSREGKGERPGRGFSTTVAAKAVAKQSAGDISGAVRAGARVKKPGAGVSGAGRAEATVKKAGGEVSSSGRREARVREYRARLPVG